MTWGPEIAAVYDEVNAADFEPAALDPMVDFLAALVSDRPALEFAVGTGRVALALHARGVSVQGIELSASMVARMAVKPDADGVRVTVGDMATTRVQHPSGGGFGLVYLVANTLMNLTTQQEQVAVFRNAAAHLDPGGVFVVELGVPAPVGGLGRVFTLTQDHVGIETYDDLVGQIASSHHWMQVRGELVHHAAPYRYVWPSELVLMAELAGLRLRERWADWQRAPFVPDSPSQVAVFGKARELGHAPGHG